MNKSYSLCERAFITVASAVRRNALTISASLCFGFLAHMFAFTNKLLNADETAALFSKGATVTSGRWGLELTRLVFPDISMPWIYGVLALLLMTAAVCFAVDLFDFKKTASRVLLCGAFMAFPAVTGNFCYMFTSASYSLAIFLAVLAVWLFAKGGKGRAAAGCVVLALSLGIYQAYVALAASFCVVWLIKALMQPELDVKSALKAAVRFFALLVVTLVLYYAVTLAVEAALGAGYQEYEVTSGGGILHRLLVTYSAFVGIFTSGNFGFVTSGVSLAAHCVCAVIIVFGAAVAVIRTHDAKRGILMLILTAIYPLSVNCMYLAASSDIIHTLVIFSFVSFYVLTLAVLDNMPDCRKAVRYVCAAAMAVIILSNVYFANKVYLKMYLEYENAFSFYNSLMADIMETPQFERYTVIDLVGSTRNGLTDFDEELDLGNFMGVNDDLVNIYTRVSFIKYYLGLDLYMYREDTILDCDWYDEMPCYPEEGYIKFLPDEGRLVVKLS